MSIRERMGELQAQGQAEKEALEKRDKEQEQERRERYQREYPEALRTQRTLFDELKEMGIIEMLEEMTHPDKISPIQTPEESKAMMERLYEKAKNLPATVSQEEASKIWRGMEAQEWDGRMLHPHQNADGSLDTTLRIQVDNNVYKNSFSGPWSQLRKAIILSYTQERILTIKGATIEFNGHLDASLGDKLLIKEALARAFFKPQGFEPTHPTATSQESVNLGPSPSGNSK